MKFHPNTFRRALIQTQGANALNARWMHNGDPLWHKIVTPRDGLNSSQTLHATITTRSITKFAVPTRDYSVLTSSAERIPSFAFAFEWVKSSMASYRCSWAYSI